MLNYEKSTQIFPAFKAVNLPGKDQVFPEIKVVNLRGKQLANTQKDLFIMQFFGEKNKLQKLISELEKIDLRLLNTFKKSRFTRHKKR